MTRRHLLFWTLLIATVATLLRLPLLDARPMHADEAILADKLGALLEEGRYNYDPGDYHGPVLLYAARVCARLAGEPDYRSLRATTVRLAPAIAGIFLSLSPLLFLRSLGAEACVASGLLIASSPMAVYYSRFFIPESLMVLLTVLMIVSLFWKLPAIEWLHLPLTVVLAGFALATKETAIIAIAAVMIAAWAAKLRFSPTSLVLAATMLLLLLLLAGVDTFAQAARNYGQKALAGELHAHPWYFYFQRISGVGFEFSEAALLALGLFGFAYPNRNRNTIFWKAFTAVVAIVYCILPYKTPWSGLTLVFGIAMLAGLAFQTLMDRNPPIASLMLLVVVALGSWQAWSASTSSSSSPANPWAYAQTGPGVFEIERTVRRVIEGSADFKVAVWTTANPWPLPWYFRQFSNVAWSRGVPGEKPAPVIVATEDLLPSIRRKLYEEPPPGQRRLYIQALPPTELRPGVPVVVLTTPAFDR